MGVELSREDKVAVEKIIGDKRDMWVNSVG